VFTGYQTPEDSVVRWELLDWDVDIVLGGVEVSPGDVIVGDLDGVVVVPRGIAQTVLEETEARADDEQTVRGAIRDGRSPLDAYDQYGVF
jgi:regulator of RNase E activity RraA